MYEFDSSLVGRCNVIVESFEENDWAIMRNMKAQGSEWIILATEYVTGDTFNHFPELVGAQQYEDRAHWKERFERFVQCAEYCRAIWLAMDTPEQLEAYRAIVPPHVPVLPLPVPFCPKLYDAVKPMAKDIDVLFTGTTTPHRMAILSALTPHARVFGTRYMPEYLRREFVARSFINLSLRQSPGWPYPSLLRFWYLLNQGALVVGERCPVPCGLDPYVVQADTSVLPTEIGRAHV